MIATAGNDSQYCGGSMEVVYKLIDILSSATIFRLLFIYGEIPVITQSKYLEFFQIMPFI